MTYIIIMIKQSLVFLLIVSLGLSITLNCDSYLDLSPQGYKFDVINAVGSYAINITGLPQGLALKGNTLTPISHIDSGQYILGIKATDSNQQTD